MKQSYQGVCISENINKPSSESDHDLTCFVHSQEKNKKRQSPVYSSKQLDTLYKQHFLCFKKDVSSLQNTSNSLLKKKNSKEQDNNKTKVVNKKEIGSKKVEEKKDINKKESLKKDSKKEKKNLEIEPLKLEKKDCKVDSKNEKSLVKPEVKKDIKSRKKECIKELEIEKKSIKTADHPHEIKEKLLSKDTSLQHVHNALKEGENTCPESRDFQNEPLDNVYIERNDIQSLYEKEQQAENDAFKEHITKIINRFPGVKAQCSVSCFYKKYDQPLVKIEQDYGASYAYKAHIIACFKRTNPPVHLEGKTVKFII